MTRPKKTKKTRDQLERAILELEAQLVHVYHFADQTLHKAAKLYASGVLVQLTALGGEEIIPPVVVKDGLSQETVDALRRDLVRSYELAAAFKPKGVQ